MFCTPAAPGLGLAGVPQHSTPPAPRLRTAASPLSGAGSARALGTLKFALRSAFSALNLVLQVQQFVDRFWSDTAGCGLGDSSV